MPTKNKPATNGRPSSDDPLAQFFADAANKRLSTAEYVAQGVTRVGPAQIQQMESELPELRKKIQGITSSNRLQQRLELLADFLRESGNGSSVATETRREVAFALAYFSHGSDRIPDETPDYGLLDDALVVEAVLERNGAALRQHWDRSGLALPDPL
jgi:uncharacterized membrane protein YkvA (DUF1232 family)